MKNWKPAQEQNCKEIQRKNNALEQLRKWKKARTVIEIKAKEFRIHSRYKSEFYGEYLIITHAYLVDSPLTNKPGNLTDKLVI